MKKRKLINPIVSFIIIILASLVTISISAVLLVLSNNSLKEKESLLPESAISSYFKELKNNNYDVIFESIDDIRNLNTKENYIESIKNIYKDINLDKLIYIKDENDNLYNIVLDNKLISHVKLDKIDNKWIASTIFKGDNTYKFQIDEGINLKLNNKAVDKSYILKDKSISDNMTGYKSSKAKNINTYVIDNMIEMPSINLDSGYGYIKDTLSNTFYIGQIYNEYDIVELLKDAATTIAKFPAKNSSIAKIANYTYKDSDFYKRISTMNNQWFATHSLAQISNIKVSDIIKQTENQLIANVTLEYYIASASASRTYKIGYQITLFKENTKWKIAGFSIDNSLVKGENHD